MTTFSLQSSGYVNIDSSSHTYLCCQCCCILLTLCLSLSDSYTSPPPGGERQLNHQRFLRCIIIIAHASNTLIRKLEPPEVDGTARGVFSTTKEVLVFHGGCGENLLTFIKNTLKTHTTASYTPQVCLLHLNYDARVRSLMFVYACAHAHAPFTGVS